MLAALKTGSGTGIGVKEQVLSRIQQKMFADVFNGECDQQNGDGEKANSPLDGHAIPKQEMNGADSIADEVENVTPPIQKPTNQSQGSRRRKVKPSKYIPEMFTCDMCNKRFEHQSQYIQHCCFKIAEDAAEGEASREEEETTDAGSEQEQQESVKDDGIVMQDYQCESAENQSTDCVDMTDINAGADDPMMDRYASVAMESEAVVCEDI